MHCPWGSAALRTWQSGEQDTVLPWGSQDGAHPLGGPWGSPCSSLEAEALWVAPWAGPRGLEQLPPVLRITDADFAGPDLPSR